MVSLSAADVVDISRASEDSEDELDKRVVGVGSLGCVEHCVEEREPEGFVAGFDPMWRVGC